MLDVAERLRSLQSKLGAPLYALLSGYPATFFARVGAGGFEPPPETTLEAFSGRNFAIDWDLFYDIRVWGHRGEWHAWRADEWCDRIRMFDDLKGEDLLSPRRYPILGRHEGGEQDGWVLRVEGRGPQVWVPIEWFHGKGDRSRWRPVLEIWPIVEPEPQFDTGLYGVADSVIHRGTCWEEAGGSNE